MAVSIVYRGFEVLISGEEHAVSAAADVFERMDQRLEDRGSLCETDGSDTYRDLYARFRLDVVLAVAALGPTSSCGRNQY